MKRPRVLWVSALCSVIDAIKMSLATGFLILYLVFYNGYFPWLIGVMVIVVLDLLAVGTVPSLLAGRRWAKWIAAVWQLLFIAIYLLTFESSSVVDWFFAVLNIFSLAVLLAVPSEIAFFNRDRIDHRWRSVSTTHLTL